MGQHAWPAVETHAVRIALDAVRKLSDADWQKLCRYHLSRDQAKLIAAGGTPVIKQDSKAATSIIELLLPTLDSARNQSRAERFRASLCAAFGERAFIRARFELETAAKRQAAQDDEREAREHPARGVYLSSHTVTVKAIDSRGEAVMTIQVDLVGGNVPGAIAAGYAYLEETDPVEPTRGRRSSAPARRGPLSIA